jgi:hypothetical protein
MCTERHVNLPGLSSEENRQLALIEKNLTERGYKLKAHLAAQSNGAWYVLVPAERTCESA